MVLGWNHVVMLLSFNRSTIVLYEYFMSHVITSALSLVVCCDFLDFFPNMSTFYREPKEWKHSFSRLNQEGDITNVQACAVVCLWLLLLWLCFNVVRLFDIFISYRSMLCVHVSIDAWSHTQSVIVVFNRWVERVWMSLVDRQNLFDIIFYHVQISNFVSVLKWDRKFGIDFLLQQSRLEWLVRIAFNCLRLVTIRFGEK